MRATSSSFDTAVGAVASCLSSSHHLPSERSVSSSGADGAISLLPTDGSSISPGLTSGAVTMKITSSTSITSMYGTTLIWLIGLRTRLMCAPTLAASFCNEAASLPQEGAQFVARVGPSPRMSSLPLEDVGELLDE